MRQDVSCIMTMPQVTWLCQCGNSLWKNKFHSCCSYRIWHNVHHYFRLFQRLKMGLQGQCFAMLRYLMQHECQPAQHTNRGFPQVLPSIAKLLKQVCVCVCVHAEGMYLEEDHWKALHFKYLSFMAEFQELITHTHC
jgi:hypothetical protein